MDKVHFYLQGFVNAQNCRIWATENSLANALMLLIFKGKSVAGLDDITYCRAIDFKEMSPTGPVTSTVEDKLYESLVQPGHSNTSTARMSVLDRIIFTQDGAHPHIAKQVMQLLKRHFGNDNPK